MKGYLLISAIAVLYALAIVHVTRGGSSSSSSTVNVCAYSNSPTDYAPKCYACGNDIYTNALLACVNATTMPRNITYKAADCMEKNCGIANYPTSPPLPFDQLNKISPILSFFQRLVRPSRSVDPVSAEKETVKEVETFVSKREITITDMDYM